MRTKQVFPTNEIAHLWANKKQSSARNSGGNLYFEGDKIYSYGSHFCIARLLDNGKVLFTNRSYSNTTSKHIWAVRSACNHLELIEIAHPEDWGVSENLKDFQSQIKDNLEVINNTRKRQATRDQAKGNLQSVVANIEKYLQVVNATDKKVRQDLNSDYKEFSLYLEAAKSEQSAAELTAKLEKKRKADERKRDKARKEAYDKYLVKLKAWRRGAKHDLRFGYYEGAPIYLRVEGDKIATSAGARVSYEAGKLLYKLIKSGKDVKGHEIDGYTVISLNGVLTIGCHKIERKEVDRFAKSQKW